MHTLPGLLFLFSSSSCLSVSCFRFIVQVWNTFQKVAGKLLAEYKLQTFLQVCEAYFVVCCDYFRGVVRFVSVLASV